MATTQEILDAARKLGELIASHDAAKKLEQAVKKLNEDRDAQRVAADLNRHMQALAQKEAEGRPIEVEDKRKMEQLQSALATNLVLSQFQMAQMDYLDLMRKVDEAIEGEAAGDVPTPAAAPPMGGIVTGG